MALARRSLAQAICAFALRISPPHRAPLACAMLVELDHVGDDEIVAFAIGCFWSAAKWRLATAEGVINGVRMAIFAGTAPLAAICFVVAVNLWTGGARAAWAIAVIGIYYAGAAALALRSGLTAVTLYGLAGLALNTLAFVAQRRLDGEGEAAAFLRALVIEEYGLLLCLLGVTQGARWVASRLKAPA